MKWKESKISSPAALPEPEVIDFKALADACARGDVNLVVVLGPTASGKTRYAVNLAGALESAIEIISADSRQVYRGMDIGTGKDIAEYGDVPYHLIDVADPGDGYNVFRFRQDFFDAFSGIRSRGNIPVLCGGTGLYINSVINGYNFVDHTPLSAVRNSSVVSTGASGVPSPEAVGFGERASGEGTPEAAAGQHELFPIVGFGERAFGEGTPEAAAGQHELYPIAGFGERASGEDTPEVKPFVIGTLVSREVRNARIDLRLKARLEEGMVDEVRGLLDSGVPEETLIGYGLEYRYVTLFLKGELTYEEMCTKLATAIHQFAKRQMTWFRGMERSGVRIHWTEVSSN